jgi:cellobiose-specific phosphotransferase system component IIC
MKQRAMQVVGAVILVLLGGAVVWEFPGPVVAVAAGLVGVVVVLILILGLAMLLYQGFLKFIEQNASVRPGSRDEGHTDGSTT